MTGLWMEDWGMETTESIVITDGKPELLSTFAYVYDALGIKSDEENEGTKRGFKAKKQN